MWWPIGSCANDEGVRTCAVGVRRDTVRVAQSRSDPLSTSESQEARFCGEASGRPREAVGRRGGRRGEGRQVRGLHTDTDDDETLDHAAKAASSLNMTSSTTGRFSK